MYVEGAEGAVLRGSDGGRKSGNRGRQGGGSIEVANATVCERCQEVSRVDQLLQMSCQPTPVTGIKPTVPFISD